MLVREPLNKIYRPNTFEAVIGQDLLVTFLRSALKKNKHPNGWLISGSFGSGKTTLARLYAKALFCPQRDLNMNPCNTCESCRAIEKGHYPNYREEDSASNSGAKDIEGVLKRASDLPYGGSEYRIVVLDECHMISSAGQSKLLKTLEEGMPHVIFMLLTTDLDKIKEPVRSRMQQVSVSTCTTSQISALLKSICEKEKIMFELPALEEISRKSRGHIRDAIMVVDQIASLNDITVEFIDQFFHNTSLMEVVNLISYISSDVLKSFEILDSLTQIMGALEIKTLMLKVFNASSKYRFFSNVDPITEEDKAFRDLHLQYGDHLFNMFHFLSSDSCESYSNLENLVMILNTYTKDKVVYSATSHIDSGKSSLQTAVRKKSYKKVSSIVIKDSLISPNEFARAIKGEIV